MIDGVVCDVISTATECMVKGLPCCRMIDGVVCDVIGVVTELMVRKRSVSYHTFSGAVVSVTLC
jgi:hypothetical protein